MKYGFNTLDNHEFKHFEKHPITKDRVLHIPSLNRIDNVKQYRVYETPEGSLYPSVTSVLGTIDKPELKAWQLRMGLEEAEKWANRAAVKGTYLHEMCEKYLLNKLYQDKNEYNFISCMNFLPIKEVLDKSVNNIIAIEKQIYSDKLKVAGTVDLIAEYNGKLTIIDFKTSNQYKYRDMCEGYFMQGSAYAYMVNEWWNLGIQDIVIIMAVDGGQVLIYEEKVKDHFMKFLKLRVQFKEKHGE